VLPEDSGDGFVELADGSRRWVASARPDLAATRRRIGHVALLRRAPFEGHPQRRHVGVPGGARHREETPLAAAIREFREEIGYQLAEFDVNGRLRGRLCDWSYWTWLVEVADRNVGREVLNWETDEVRWVTAD